MGKATDGQMPLQMPGDSSTEPGKLGLLITTLLRHYYPLQELDKASLTLMAADWLQALKDHSFLAIAEARRRWLEREDRKPVIASFLASVRDIESTPEGQLGPPPEYLLPERRSPFSKLAPPEKWCWYARRHAFRRMAGFKGPAPFDKQSRFFNDALVEQAEAEMMGNDMGVFCGKLRREADGNYVRPEVPADARAVRPNWRRIRFFDLTEAERDLFAAHRMATYAKYPGTVDPKMIEAMFACAPEAAG